jgi:hypothetical protein
VTALRVAAVVVLHAWLAACGPVSGRPLPTASASAQTPGRDPGSTSDPADEVRGLALRRVYGQAPDAAVCLAVDLSSGEAATPLAPEPLAPLVAEFEKAHGDPSPWLSDRLNWSRLTPASRCWRSGPSEHSQVQIGPVHFLPGRQAQVAIMEEANEGFPTIYLCSARKDSRWVSSGCKMVFQA